MHRLRAKFGAARANEIQALIAAATGVPCEENLALRAALDRLSRGEMHPSIACESAQSAGDSSQVRAGSRRVVGGGETGGGGSRRVDQRRDKASA